MNKFFNLALTKERLSRSLARKTVKDQKIKLDNIKFSIKSQKNHNNNDNHNNNITHTQ